MDEILPPLREVQQALQAYPNLPSDYQGLNTVTEWVNKLSALKATDSMSEDDARQLKFDLEGCM